jgi:hypothetical protein
MRFEPLPRSYCAERMDIPTEAPRALTAAIANRDSARMTFEDSCRSRGLDPRQVLADEEEPRNDAGE